MKCSSHRQTAWGTEHVGTAASAVRGAQAPKVFSAFSPFLSALCGKSFHLVDLTLTTINPV